MDIQRPKRLKSGVMLIVRGSVLFSGERFVVRLLV